MEKRFLRSILLSVVFLLAFMPGFAMATDCVVTPKSLQMNYTTMPKAGVPIDFTLDAVSSCSGSLFYFFTYIPDYGSASYDAYNNWVNMMTGTQVVTFTPSNTVRYTFDTPGYYIVVGDVMPTEAFPAVRNIIGTSVAVQENSGGTGTCPFQATGLNMTVTNALNGEVVPGATVTALGQTNTTNSSGSASLINLPTDQDVVVQASAPGYITQSLQVRLACGQVQTQGLALLPSGDAGVASGDIRVILTWGENPSDLDSHITGPKSDGSTDRFHVYYSNTNNNGSGAASDTTIPCWLDVDDVTSYGPETVSVNKSGSSYVAGTYRYYVHHYSGSNNIPTSGAVVQVYKGSQLIRSFSAPTTTDANVGDNYVWSVFEMALGADGSYTINPVNTYSSTGYSSYDTTVFRNGVKLPSFIPEVYQLFMSMPAK